MSKVNDIFENSANPENYPHIRESRRVICAALRAKDGDVLLGIRHYSQDMHRQIEARHDGYKFKNLLDENQGFIDQWGQYMSREEAYLVATEARQTVFEEHCGAGLNGKKLYSEALY